MKELDKLTTRLEREKARLAKKTAAAEKLGATCSRSEWYAGMREAYTAEQGIAYCEAWQAEDDVKDTERQIENAKKRLAKAEVKVSEVLAKRANESKTTSRVEALTKIVEEIMSEMIGGYENQRTDSPEGSEDYAEAVEFLTQEHEAIVEQIFNESRTRREAQEHLKFAGNDTLHGIVESKVTAWGY